LIEKDSETALHIAAWTKKQREAAMQQLLSPVTDFPVTQFLRGKISALNTLDDELKGNGEVMVFSTDNEGY
jgi:hypothetical protein